MPSFESLRMALSRMSPVSKRKLVPLDVSRGGRTVAAVFRYRGGKSEHLKNQSAC